VADLTALEQAKQTHVRYVLIVGLAPICRKCHVDWPCLTGRMIAEHEALQARADRAEGALREIIAYSPPAHYPLGAFAVRRRLVDIARAALAEDAP